MDTSWRSSSWLAAGALGAGIVVLAIYLGWFRPGPAPAAPERAAAAPEAVVPITATPTPQSVAQASSCPGQPLAVARTDADGRFELEPVLASTSNADANAFLAVAREASQQGRPHDAEVALLAACHVAEQAAGARSSPLADVKSHLGQQYVELAAREQADDVREGLLQRASAMFADSAQVYAAVLGRQASKTRMAEERLAAVREPETLRAALRESPARATETMGAAPAALPRGQAGLLVRSDPELAQMEYDLQRLRSQAASVTRDPRGLEARHQQALAQREARCQDKACLQRWYAQRRAQLLDEF